MFALRSALTLISRIPQQLLFPQVRSDGRLVPAAGGVAGASRLQGPRHPCLPVQPGALGRHHGGKDIMSMVIVLMMVLEMMMMSKAILLISSPATSAAGHGEYNEGDEDESEDYFFTNL